jgi:NAD-dependent oxidoreductase involved in siderophore biosynthesis
VNHIYGENEMGGTSWLYLSAVPHREVGMREDLGITPAPQLTAGALSGVPIVVGLWPVLLSGIYAINKRKEKIEADEKKQAIAAAIEKTRAEAEKKLADTREKAEKDKVAAIEKALKKALEETAHASKQAVSDVRGGEVAKKSSEEES